MKSIIYVKDKKGKRDSPGGLVPIWVMRGIAWSFAVEHADCESPDDIQKACVENNS